MCDITVVCSKFIYGLHAKYSASHEKDATKESIEMERNFCSDALSFVYAFIVRVINALFFFIVYVCVCGLANCISFK